VSVGEWDRYIAAKLRRLADAIEGGDAKLTSVAIHNDVDIVGGDDAIEPKPDVVFLGQSMEFKARSRVVLFDDPLPTPQRKPIRTAARKGS